MRRIGWLLLAGCLALAAVTGWMFQQQKAQQTASAPQKPKLLASGIQALASGGWRWSEVKGDRISSEVTAQRFTQQSDPPRVDLEEVELKLYHKDGQTYDLIKSKKAELRQEDSILYSDGEVDITLGYHTDPKIPNRLINIKTSGVAFNTQSGVANTDRHAEFVFETSSGSSTGASYDPNIRELHMHSEAQLLWTKSAKPMKVESGALTYKELEDKVYLEPWSRLTRDTLVLNAAKSVVSLKEGEIQLVESDSAAGVDRQPTRLVEYGADKMFLHFAEKSTINKIEGQNNARLSTQSAAGNTKVTANRVDMDFAPKDGESILTKAVGTGKTVVESHPPQKSARVLRSEIVELTMREGGEEMEKLVTQTPGEIEFIPQSPAERYRKMNGERLDIRYGAGNQMENFHATKVTTFTKGKPKKPDSTTSSEELEAKFDAKTGDMTLLEQWNNFRYQEGDRFARSERAKLDQPTDHITLTGTARIWDNSGSTDAAVIELDQKTGDMVATGKVNSTRLPEKKQKTGKSSLLDASETIQARADKMTTKDSNHWIRYEGSATLWQGADKIDGDVVTIDRGKQQLLANGNVFTQTREKPKPDVKQPRQQVFTLVRAPEFIYTEADKTGYYKGGVTMHRGDLKVTSRELRAFFSKDDPKTEEDEGNSMERATADGNVEILQPGKDRTRRGNSEHADFDVNENKVVLTGGAPLFDDSLKGITRGRKLTWFSDTERLLVDGEASAPAVSRLKRKVSK